MQWMQKHVLEEMARGDGATFVSLKPEGVDSNLFTYHLNKLTTDGYIKNTDKKYSLTSKGKSYLAGLSLSAGGPAEIPRLFAMLYIENSKGELALYRWNRQPYSGHVSLPFGRILRGKTVEETARENLGYKTGIKAEIKYAGSVDVIVLKGDRVSTHYLAYLYKARVADADVFADGLTGEPFWGNPEDHLKDEVYGMQEIVEVVKKSKDLFFEEITLRKTDIND